LAVSILAALIWIVRQVVNRRRVDEHIPPVVQHDPVKPETKDYSSPSALEIVEDIKSRPLYQQHEAERHYVGLKVRWRLNVVSVRQQAETGAMARLLCNVDGSYPWITATDISFTKHPELKILRADAELWISGTIERVEGHDICLSNAEIG
jgi:hypothetical protein